MLLRKLCLILITSCFVLAGCNTNTHRETYSRNEVNRVQTTQGGVIERTSVVEVGGEKTWVGTTTGAVAGGLLGSLIGNGWGRAAAVAVGGLAGGVIGSGVEGYLRSGEGLKLDIALDNGERFSTIVVPKKNQPYPIIGERVRVVTSSSGKIEVMPE